MGSNESIAQVGAPGGAPVQESLFDVAVDDLPTAEVGYRGPTVLGAVGITYRQLDYWARTGLVEPSIRAAAGSGTQRLYSFKDVLVLRVVKRLLDAGISLPNIRTAVAALRERGVSDLAGITLVTDGASVYECTSSDEVVDLLQGGQVVIGLALKGVVADMTGTLAHLPSERLGEAPAAPSAGDELAQRRARRRAG
jgi:DNA-binding transcriptional MerR regulator